MTPVQKQIEVFRECERLVFAAWPNAFCARLPDTDVIYRDVDLYDEIGHILWMIAQGCMYLETGYETKGAVWLGFVQCWLWMRGIATIDEMRDMARLEGNS